MFRTMQTVTQKQYDAFQTAYNFFNRELFGDKLPHVLITLQRHAKSRGYFAPKRFNGRKEKSTTVHELAMNPDYFIGRTDEEILSTLVHEMAHVWQQAFGKPSRGGYHNKQWAQKMFDVGLFASDTGEVGGKTTGQRVSHYIIPDGVYQAAYKKLAKTGLTLDWESVNIGKKARKARNKTKYTCLSCGLNAWAKPDACIQCGDCEEIMEQND